MKIKSTEYIAPMKGNSRQKNNNNNNNNNTNNSNLNRKVNNSENIESDLFGDFGNMNVNKQDKDDDDIEMGFVNELEKNIENDNTVGSELKGLSQFEACTPGSMTIGPFSSKKIGLWNKTVRNDDKNMENGSLNGLIASPAPQAFASSNIGLGMAMSEMEISRQNVKNKNKIKENENDSENVNPNVTNENNNNGSIDGNSAKNVNVMNKASGIGSGIGGSASSDDEKAEELVTEGAQNETGNIKLNVKHNVKQNVEQNVDPKSVKSKSMQENKIGQDSEVVIPPLPVVNVNENENEKQNDSRNERMVKDMNNANAATVEQDEDEAVNKHREIGELLRQRSENAHARNRERKTENENENEMENMIDSKFTIGQTFSQNRETSINDLYLIRKNHPDLIHFFATNAVYKNRKINISNVELSENTISYINNDLENKIENFLNEYKSDWYNSEEKEQGISDVKKSLARISLQAWVSHFIRANKLYSLPNISHIQQHQNDKVKEKENENEIENGKNYFESKKFARLSHVNTMDDDSNESLDSNPDINRQEAERIDNQLLNLDISQFSNFDQFVELGIDKQREIMKNLIEKMQENLKENIIKLNESRKYIKSNQFLTNLANKVRKVGYNSMNENDVDIDIDINNGNSDRKSNENSAIDKLLQLCNERSEKYDRYYEMEKQMNEIDSVLFNNAKELHNDATTLAKLIQLKIKNREKLMQQQSEINQFIKQQRKFSAMNDITNNMANIDSHNRNNNNNINNNNSNENNDMVPSPGEFFGSI